ncbi:hypothetical protein [Thiocystis violacea]|uniref:hypothetical protein n=1 Tax=Thiocystis violacea TaxID=13725 RepID=UPI0019030CB5|nr:hypothetical protein [Thiocystis violacea]MBK1717344.1 hypothetical protein [Thiocystis violacea]
MRAIELETEIDENQEIHLKLPADVQVRKARIVVLYEERDGVTGHDTPAWPDPARRPRQFGQFRGQVRMGDDFDAPLPDDVWLGGHA